MKKLLLCVALMGVTGLCYAQLNTAYTPPTITPQAPETASLLKFTETPVSYHTGVPNISIPIASISGRGLSASVSISYHAGGLRVTEESSWLGLGWNLSAGGQITRSKRGGADDHYPNGFIYTDVTVDSLVTACAQNNLINNLNCTQLTNNEGGYDYEPDDFNYSMLGLSGRFMFDQNRDSTNPKGNVIQFPEKNVIITPIYDTIVSLDYRKRIIAWDIKDTNGTVYHFKEGNIFLKSENKPYKMGGACTRT